MIRFDANMGVLMGILLACGCIAGCNSHTAIDEGTCSGAELQALQDSCVASGCSSSGSKQAVGLDSCTGDVELANQSGGVKCGLQGSGSCTVGCDCPSGEAAANLACAGWGWNDCLVGRPPRGEDIGCTDLLWAVYENEYCRCEDTNGYEFCTPFSE